MPTYTCTYHTMLLRERLNEFSEKFFSYNFTPLSGNPESLHTVMARKLAHGIRNNIIDQQSPQKLR